ncbi:MAG TPA: o-succinylbenzoate synthase [Ktedonobacteraceae bacterium]|nr:o-succinylbenzoate synthase [Ktedonobacteraceae bacterium]
MKLTALHWLPYRIPFREAFITAHGALTHRSGALVRVSTSTGRTGYGEIAPLPTHSGSGLNEALTALARLAPAIRGQDIGDVLRFLEMGEQEAQLPAALRCGLEMALLDAWGQDRQASIAALLTGAYAAEQVQEPLTTLLRVPVNAVMSGTPGEATLAKVRAAIAAGFTCLKMKVIEASQATVEWVAALRAALGPLPRLRLDANEGWTLEQARWMLEQCVPYDIQYVEQPLHACDLEGMARLRRNSPIALAADEAISGLDSARRVLEADAADVLILKPQLAGGLRTCRQIIREAHRRGVACVITSTLETGVGIAAALQLAAASPEVTMACGLATSDLLEDDLLRESLMINNGHMSVPAGSGLGVQLRLKEASMAWVE